MNELTIPAFVSGVHNLIDPENIPRDAAKDAVNFVTKDGRVILVPGREPLGSTGAVGGTQGSHVAYKADGQKIIFCKFGTTIKYWDGSAWQTCISGLSALNEVTYANYSSLSGTSMFINGPDGYWKVMTANPGSPIDVYDAARNFKGYILIDRGRTILWNRDKDKTGLYGSWIDRQNSTVYTTVSAEAVGASGSTNYTGTLAFKAGGAKRNAFGTTFTALTGAGQESFVDNIDGTVTSNLGGTGTINYATGAYNVTFANVTTGAATATYQWEDATVKGVADFTFSSTRVTGEGFQFPQDEGGDAILSVQIGQDGAYYSMKSNSAYRLELDADDAGATNEVYRKEMGLPYFRACISTSKGIFFINTANPTDPTMMLLQRSKIAPDVEPVILFRHFKFANYVYDHCAFASYDRWVLVFCRTADSVTNDRILLCNIEQKTVDIVAYTGNTAVQVSGLLYVADSVSQSVYSTFSGFDDLGNAVEAYWEGKDETQGKDTLKKTRRLRFKGSIDPDQSAGIYVNLDEAGYSKVGTIWGGASYVNYNESQTIGSNYIGEVQLGGDDVVNAYGYYMEMKIRTGKYRKMSVKVVPEGIGYFDFDTITLWDNLMFEDRMPRAYRQKQKVSLDGTETDQP